MTTQVPQDLDGDRRPPAPADPPRDMQSRPRGDPWRVVGRYGALMVLALMVVVVSALEPQTFPTESNLINILTQSAPTALIAMGVTFPLVAGEFDLSVGAAGSLCGVIACQLMLNSGFDIPLAFAAAVGVGAAVGIANGFIVIRLGVNSIVATLGVSTIIVGINYAIAGGLPVTLANPTGFLQLTLGKFLGIPYPVYIMVGVAMALWLLLNRTILGQSIQATGGNPVAARLSGVRVDRVRLAVLVIAGACAAVTGVLLASVSGSAAVDGADSYLLSAYAAAFFGSAVLREGQFHIVGTVVGVLTVAVGFNAISVLGLSVSWQYLFQGSLLILGVAVASFARRRAR
jgi:ribose transport system permease protein